MLVRRLWKWDGPCPAELDFAAIVVALAHTLLAGLVDSAFAFWPSAAEIDREVLQQLTQMASLLFALTLWTAPAFGFWFCHKMGVADRGGHLSVAHFLAFSGLGALLFSAPLTPMLSGMWPPPICLVALSACTSLLNLTLILQLSTKPA